MYTIWFFYLNKYKRIISKLIILGDNIVFEMEKNYIEKSESKSILVHNWFSFYSLFLFL